MPKLIKSEDRVKIECAVNRRTGYEFNSYTWRDFTTHEQLGPEHLIEEWRVERGFDENELTNKAMLDWIDGALPKWRKHREDITEYRRVVGLKSENYQALAVASRSRLRQLVGRRAGATEVGQEIASMMAQFDKKIAILSRHNDALRAHEQQTVKMLGDLDALRAATVEEITKEAGPICPPCPKIDATEISTICSFQKLYGNVFGKVYSYAAVRSPETELWSVTGRAGMSAITWHQLLQFIQSDEQTTELKQRALDSFTRMQFAPVSERRTGWGRPLMTPNMRARSRGEIPVISKHRSTITTLEDARQEPLHEKVLERAEPYRASFAQTARRRPTHSAFRDDPYA